MKVAITNGWLVFDNEIPGNVEDHYPYKFRRGRLRLDSVSSYAELCGQCMSRVRCLLGAHLDVEVSS